MDYTSVTNPTWVNDHLAIQCTVLFAGFAAPVPFVARENDIEPHGKEIFTRCLAGEFGEIATLEPSLPTLESQIAELQQGYAGYLETVAKEQGFPSQTLFLLRAAAPGPFQAKAVAYMQWVDQCSVIATQLFIDLKQGTFAIPTQEAMLSLFPKYVAPQ